MLERGTRARSSTYTSTNETPAQQVVGETLDLGPRGSIAMIGHRKLTLRTRANHAREYGAGTGGAEWVTVSADGRLQWVRSRAQLQEVFIPHTLQYNSNSKSLPAV